ncbi:MAG: S41 family peptidase, partial [Pseudomonadota bacterium]
MTRIALIVLGFSAVFSSSAQLLATTSADAPATAVEIEEIAPSDRHRKESRLVTTLFEHSHYRKAKVDDELSAAILERYLDALDAGKVYFLASDIKRFNKYRRTLDDSVRKGAIEPVFDIFALYRERAGERLNHALALLEIEPDFTLDESYEFDREDAEWAASAEDLKELWRKRVKNEMLSLVLTDKTWEEAADVLRKRYNRVLRRTNQLTSDEVFETFMNAYADTLDPHSNYFSPRNSEEYRIQMSLSYDGIGASLRLTDDYVEVLEIIPGGAAAVDGELAPKDRITGVAQGDDAMQDVIGWRLDDVVQLIRGPSGTTVRLQVLPAGAPPGGSTKVLALTRDKVKLEAQAAQRDTINVPLDDGEATIGVINVPSFYQDYQARAAGDRDYTSTTSDVRRLVKELIEEENIDGLVIDLRGNGGGHLSEATALTGLFIEDGPVVQLRDFRERIEVLEDPVPSVVYDGPLAVLVDRYSASASEIFAAAIQDYQRGLVIGQTTFGKGSVQNLYDLNRYARSKTEGLGQLTLTIGKYYRVTGGSTQHRGVVPDIAMPSAVDTEEVGESTRPTALPWDQIRPTIFEADSG